MPGLKLSPPRNVGLWHLLRGFPGRQEESPAPAPVVIPASVGPRPPSETLVETSETLVETSETPVETSETPVETSWTPVETSGIYLSVAVKFALSMTFTVIWVAASVWISRSWVNELAPLTSTVAAWAIVILVAYLPGSIVAFMAASLILDRQPPCAWYRRQRR